MTEQNKIVTKFKKVNAYKTDIYVDERQIGSVEQNLSGGWILNPSFPPLQEEEYFLKRTYFGPVEAGKKLATLFKNYKEVRDAALGTRFYQNRYDGSLF